MNRTAPRSIQQYLSQLRDELLPVELFAGALLFTLLMHLARGVGRIHALFAKALLVTRDGPASEAAAPLPHAAH